MHIHLFKDKLNSKFNKYIDKKYPMWFILLKTILITLGEYKFLKRWNTPPKDNKLNICLYMQGGVGDIIVYNIYLKELIKKLDTDVTIDVYPTLNNSISKSLFKNYPVAIKNYELYKQGKISYYDIILDFKRLTVLKYANYRRLKEKSKFLYNYCKSLESFQANYPFIYSNPWDTIPISKDLGLALGKTRETLPDISGELGLSNETTSYLALNPKAFEILDKYNLKDKTFITIHRGLDGNVIAPNCVRLWPLSYYNELIKQIKQKYPDLTIVQLGISEDRCEKFDNIDINLIGKTSFEEVLAILKYSSFHIDYEGGFVHLRHQMNKTSCVLFGQTTIDFVGYPENINLKSNACPVACENLRRDWAYSCLRGFENAPCMTELKPDYVFKNITSFLDSVINKPEKNVEKQEVERIKQYFNENNPLNKKIVFYGKEFYEIAKKIATNNQITIYDSVLDNTTINEAKDLGIFMEYGDLYNIPEGDAVCDYVVLKKLNHFENTNFIERDFKRILKHQGKLIMEGKL